MSFYLIIAFLSIMAAGWPYAWFLAMAASKRRRIMFRRLRSIRRSPF